MGITSVGYSPPLNTATVQSSYQNQKITEKSAKDEQSSGAKSVADTGVVYEKGTGNTEKATYSVNKMSKADREALVAQLKADQEKQQSQLTNLVSKMMGKQATAAVNSLARISEAPQSRGGLPRAELEGRYGNANMWKFLASGDYKVDAATKAQAQKDISEDGYWGVKQTSQRLFDFASALAGDDVEKMKKMQSAMEKGFKLATKAWGRELPSISRDTMDAANKLFDDYYASREKDKNNITEE